jgi:antitoxin component HigA of HigAB toxin-antitoxin module
VEDIERLLSRKRQLAAADAQRLESLIQWVNDYEDQRYPIAEPLQVDMLRHLFRESGLTKKQFAEATGIASTRWSELMSGKSKLLPREASAVARHFGLPARVFGKS